MAQIRGNGCLVQRRKRIWFSSPRRWSRRFCSLQLHPAGRLQELKEGEASNSTLFRETKDLRRIR